MIRLFCVTTAPWPTPVTEIVDGSSENGPRLLSRSISATSIDVI